MYSEFLRDGSERMPILKDIYWPVGPDYEEPRPLVPWRQKRHKIQGRGIAPLEIVYPQYHASCCHYHLDCFRDFPQHPLACDTARFPLQSFPHSRTQEGW
jgi:hypothetical protein